jgi:hypothetical protein
MQNDQKNGTDVTQPKLMPSLDSSRVMAPAVTDKQSGKQPLSKHKQILLSR